MTAPANVRANVQAPFPTLVTGSGPITVGKNNGVWTVGANGDVIVAANPGPVATDFALVWDSVAKAWVKVALSNLGAGGGGGGGGGGGTGNVVGPASSTTGHLAVFADGTGKLIADGGVPGGGGNPSGLQSALTFGAVGDGVTNNDSGAFPTNWVAQGNTLTKSFPIPVTQLVPNPLQMIAQGALVASGSPVKVDSYANDPGIANNPVPAGSTIVVIVTATNVANNAITSLTDSAGNTYTQVVQNTAAAGVGSAAIFWCQSTTQPLLGGVGFFTAVVAGALQTYGLWAFKLIGGATAVNASSSTTGTGTTFSLSTGVLAANSLVLAFSYPFQSAPPRVTPAAGFNQLDNFFLGGGINWAMHASGSGLTFNAPAFNSVPYAGLIASFTVPSLTPSCPALVTMATGLKSSLDIVGHGFRLTEPFQFSGSGNLDANLSKGTNYFTVHSGFTAYQFQFSTTNTAGQEWFEGTPVNITTSYVAPISVVPITQEWVQLVFPPGAYNANNGGGSSTVLVNGQMRLLVSGYGAEVQGLLGANAVMGHAWSGDSNAWAQLQTASSGPAQGTGGNSILQMLNLTNAQWFRPNHWVSVMGLDCEAGSNFAPDNFFNQFEKIKDYDPATGRIFLGNNSRLRDTYRSSWPTYYSTTAGRFGGAGFSYNRGTAGPWEPTGGGATVFLMPAKWDCQVVYEGFHQTDPPEGQAVWAVRDIYMRDMTSDNQAISAAQCKTMIMENCTWGSGVPDGQHLLQIDKLAEYTEFRNCTMDDIQALSAGSEKTVFESCKIVNLDALGSRSGTIRNCIISVLKIGAIYGICEQVLIEASHVSYLQPANVNFGNLYGNFLSFYSFSNGTIKFPWNEGGNIYFGPASWAVPGARMFFSVGPNGDNAGSPFIVTDVYVSGGFLCMDTTLAALPAPTNNKSSIVTISAAAPAVVNWGSPHGLTAGTLIQFLGNMPGGLVNFEQPFLGANSYFVLAAGLTANTFEVATSPGGTPINTTAFADDYSLCLASFKSSGTIGTPVRFASTFPGNGGNPAIFVNAPVPAGSLIVVQISNYVAKNSALPGGTPLTDSVGNTYTKAVESTAAAGTYSTAIYFCANCTALQYGDFIKFNLANYGLQACYVANANGGLDVALSQTLVGNVSGLSLATGTLATANEVIFYGWQSVNGLGFGGASTTYAPGNGFASLTPFLPYTGNLTNNGSICSDFGYKIVAATTTQTFNPTMNIWAVANPLFLGKHPCPKLTAHNNTGCPQMNDLEGAAAEPMNSRFKRSFGGLNGANITQNPPVIWGNLVTLTFNVIKPWTGGGACTFELDIVGRDASLNPSNATLVIDCSHAGVRTVTATGVTGVQGTDSIAAFAGWISSVGIPVTLGGVGWNGPLSQQPFLVVTCQTSQGITSADNIAIQGTADSTVFMLSDSVAAAQFAAGP
jgi:hypothetical protein